MENNFYEDVRRVVCQNCDDNFCKAAVCSDLLNYVIISKCVGCGICKKKCPVNAITGDKKEVHVIDTELCIKCNACLEACPVSAIIRR